MNNKKIILGLAAGVVLSMFNIDLVQAGERHVAEDPAATTVYTENKLPVKDSKTVSFKDRIQAILKEAAAKETAKKQVAYHYGQLMHKMPVTVKDEGGTLLFSDSPEYVKQNGVLYRDTVSGEARVLYYHLNDTAEPKKVAVVLENMYDGLNSIKITRGGSGRPSADYLTVGKETQLNYFGEPMEKSMLLLKHQARLLLPQMDNIVLQPGDLVCGVYDFTAKYPVKVTVLLTAVNDDLIAAAQKLPVLPRDEVALRGTFKGMNRLITVSGVYDAAKDGAGYIPIGDEYNDKFRYGIDATDGTPTQNVGNYGILYQLKVPTAATSAVQSYLSPLGGVYAGAVLANVDNEAVKVIPTPYGTICFGDKTREMTPAAEAAWKKGTWRPDEQTELADLGIYPAGRTIYFEYSPPGASNLPVNIIFVPSK